MTISDHGSGRRLRNVRQNKQSGDDEQRFHVTGVVAILKIGAVGQLVIASVALDGTSICVDCVLFTFPPDNVKIPNPFSLQYPGEFRCYATPATSGIRWIFWLYDFYHFKAS